MGCDKKILVTAIFMDNNDFPNGCTKRIGCDLDVQGDYWATPIQNENGVFLRYDYTLSAGVSKPTTDSFRAVKLTASGDNLIVAIADFAPDNVTPNSSQILFDACDQCCGDAPLTVTTTVPAPVLEIKPCSATETGDSSASYVANVVIPADNNGAGGAGTYTYTATFTTYSPTTGAVVLSGTSGAVGSLADAAAIVADLITKFGTSGSVIAVGTAAFTFASVVTAATLTEPGVIKIKSVTPFSVGITVTVA